MKTLDYEYFFQQLKAGDSGDETCFYFSDDPKEDEHYIGFLSEYEKPYWVGFCDVENGCEFDTAEELVEAKIFNGKSLKERWPFVRIVNIQGIDLDVWLKHHPKSEL
jgi:hypothetical protein